MKTTTSVIRPAAFLLLAFATLNPQFSTLFAQGTAFTYQGRLANGTNAANGSYDLTFALFSVGSGAGQVGSTLTNNATAVSNGAFIVVLDFGANFPGADRWLEIGLRTNGGGAFSTLTPRQKITPTPYAIHAGNAGTLGGQASTAYVAKAGDTMTGRLYLPPNGLVAGGNQLVLSNGFVGIRTTSPAEALTVSGQIACFGTGLDGSTFQRFELYADTVNGTLFEAPKDSGGNKLPYHFNWRGAGPDAMTILGNGYVGIGTANPASSLHVAGRAQIGGDLELSGQGYLLGFYSPGNFDFRIAGEGSFANRTLSIADLTTGVRQDRLTINSSGDVGIGASPQLGYKLWVEGGVHARSTRPFNAYNPSTGHYVYLADSALNAAAYIHGPVVIEGQATVQVLQINGADVAEPFEVSTKDMPKGSVVVIDEENPGRLKLSDRAYDKQVAGILSGANGVRSGILLKQQGFNDAGENLALSGRVYAQADASYGAIKPGDLLTTSDTPGHCMKVTDPARAQGAIIGKAMSPLANGKGMVLVLVSLQ